MHAFSRSSAESRHSLIDVPASVGEPFEAFCESTRLCISQRAWPHKMRASIKSSPRRSADACETSKQANKRATRHQSTMHLKGIGHSTRQQATAAGNETQRDLESHRSINAQRVRRRQTTHALATAPSPRRPASSRHAAPPLADTPPHPPVCVCQAQHQLGQKGGPPKQAVGE